MTPALRLALSLVVSLLLWLPTIPSALAAHDAPTTIALRYLVALVISRVGVGLVFRVVHGYAAGVLAAEQAQLDAERAEQQAAEQAQAEQDAAEQAEFGRRRDDVVDGPSQAQTDVMDKVMADVEHDAAALVH